MAASKSTARAGDLPTVSRVFDDRTLVELLYDADTRTTALAVAHPDGTISIEERFAAPTGEWLIPYSADNNLLTSGCVLLPSTVGEEMDKGDLLAANVEAALREIGQESPINLRRVRQKGVQVDDPPPPPPSSADDDEQEA